MAFTGHIGHYLCSQQQRALSQYLSKAPAEPQESRDRLQLDASGASRQDLPDCRPGSSQPEVGSGTILARASPAPGRGSGMGSPASPGALNGQAVQPTLQQAACQIQPVGKAVQHLDQLEEHLCRVVEASQQAVQHAQQQATSIADHHDRTCGRFQRQLFRLGTKVHALEQELGARQHMQHTALWQDARAATVQRLKHTHCNRDTSDDDSLSGISVGWQSVRPFHRAPAPVSLTKRELQPKLDDLCCWSERRIEDLEAENAQLKIALNAREKFMYGYAH